MWLSAEDEQVRREVEVDASREDVWAALATPEGRAAWLEEGVAERVEVETVEAPSRLVWWWWEEREGPASRVEVTVDAVAGGRSRVVVVERRPAFTDAPTFPAAALAARFAGALAAA